MNIRRSLTLCALLAATPALGTGCIDPDTEAAFDQYRERTLDQRDAPGASGPIEGCVEANFGPDFEGTYLFALRSPLGPVPILFETTVTLLEDGDFELEFQPIKTDVDALTSDPRTDPRVPVGDPIFTTTTVNEDGTFTYRLEDVDVVGEANPLTGREIFVSFLQIEARTCTQFAFCGEVSEGQAIRPLTIPLGGSPFAAVRIGHTYRAGEAPFEVNDFDYIRTCGELLAFLVPEDEEDAESAGEE